MGLGELIIFLILIVPTIALLIWSIIDFGLHRAWSNIVAMVLSILFLGAMALCMNADAVNLSYRPSIETGENECVIVFHESTFNFLPSPEYYYNETSGVLVKTNFRGDIIQPYEYDDNNIEEFEGFKQVTEDVVISKESYELIYSECPELVDGYYLDSYEEEVIE